MNRPSIDDFEVEYARFNAQKTLSTNTPSAFEHARFGDLNATRDRARPDAYYNRILGVTPGSVDHLGPAIAWIEQDNSANIRIDISSDPTRIDPGVSHDLPADLLNHGFRHVDTLTWLQLSPADRRPRADAPAIETNTVRELTTQDWPAIRWNREHEWPIDDLIWKQKRQYLCTATFRWFGIFDGDELVSTASTWTTSTTPGASNVTILGSAFTLPAYRNRGHQRQLLAARCQVVPGPLFVDVAPDSASYRNCFRAGFTDLDHRQLWIRDGAS